MAAAEVTEFSPTDKRLCVCGHTAATHGADPGTKHACRKATSNGLTGYDEHGKPLWEGWHCPCVEFRLADLRSEAEVEVFVALAKVSPRSWDGVHGDREDAFWSADQVRGPGDAGRRDRARAAGEARRDRIAPDVHGLLPDAHVSRRRRITVAFQQVETTPMRQFRQAMTGDWETGTRRARHERWWCAADRPNTSDGALGLMVTPVYVGTKVPEDARCEVCAIGIRELQEMMAR